MKEYYKSLIGETWKYTWEKLPADSTILRQLSELNILTICIRAQQTLAAEVLSYVIAPME